MEQDSNCAIWQTAASEYYVADKDGSVFDSPRAGGKYFIDGTARSVLSNFTSDNKALLTTWLVEQRKSGDNCPNIFVETLRNIARRKALEVSTKADRVLHYLSTQTKIPGSSVTLHGQENENSFSKIHEIVKKYYEILAQSECLDGDELVFILDYLTQRGWVNVRGNINHLKCQLTVDGYIEIEEQKKAFVDSDRAFVAMWFDDSMNDAWNNGFNPAIQQAGYKPVRIDRLEFANRIDDEIIAEIRKAKFVIADFTQGDSGARGGVYYDAGFAHGLNLHVLFTCRDDSIENIHFDTRQYNHIVWRTPEELQNRLKQRIGAVIGPGPNPIPN